MKRLALALLLPLLAACAGPGVSAEQAAALARKAGLKPMTIPGRPFALAAFVRQTDPSAPVAVYIEGDGLAWLSESEPSADPTPTDPIGLKLAAADPSPNVITLARPCQYVWSNACREAYWTDRRFSEEVVQAMSAALDSQLAPGQKLHLVGYSGGGAVAALLAARRADAASLRTVAGNLDHAALNRFHGVSAMPGSLNPRDVAARLRELPQAHYVGERDEVVPPLAAESFLRAMGPSACATVVRVPGASHERGWTEFWRANQRLPVCRP
jgi:pimeloyl-ACP methyl ester carboxylesterase